MSIDLLLIDPPLSMKKRYGNFALCGSKSFSFGLAYIAAVAIRDGFNVKILDLGVTDLNDASLKQYLLSHRPRIVGFTATTIAVSDAARVAKIVKETIPDALIVIGGPHLSCAPEATIRRYTEFSIGVVGEGEMTMLELLKLPDPSQADYSKIDGLAWRQGEDVFLSNARELIKDLSSLPMPAFDLLPDLKSHYIPPYFSVKRTPAVTVMTTRGCPGRCTFCSNIVHGRRVRQYSVDYLFELTYLLTRKYGIREFQIGDDSFTLNRKRVTEFCERLIREKIDLTWSCLARVNGITPEMLNLMKRAGCWQIKYGIESGDERMLKNIRKDISLDQVHKTILMTKEAGIRSQAFFILGFPEETRESMKKTTSLALSLPIDDLALTIFTPYPGTPAYDQIVSGGSKYGTFVEDWDQMTAMNASFVAKGFTHDEMLNINRATYRKFYFRPRIVLSYLKRISGPKFFLIMAKGLFGLLSTLFIKENFSNSKP